MIDYSDLFKVLAETRLQTWLPALQAQTETTLDPDRHGDLKKWLQILQALPVVQASSVDFNSAAVTIGASDDCNAATKIEIEQLLRQLQPWRKGPFNIHGIEINTEWRSDLKWNRLAKHIQPLAGRTVLDVGCGSGYHCWRIAGAGAKLSIGIDPTLLSVVQFHAIKHFSGPEPVHVLPLSLEDLPDNLNAFDTVFSMGVLHHRRSPFDHLFKLRSCLRPGGELILDALVIEGDAGQTLVPEGRYARMRNVWFMPSIATLQSWLKRTGYRNIHCIDVSKTTTAEQRRTDWMTFESLSDFLDPDNPDLTVEGLPAPRRAIFWAEAP